MATAPWTCWWATRPIRPARWPRGSIRPATTIEPAVPSASPSPPRRRSTAGANASVTVTAVDALGNPVPGFLGTVDLDNTPAGSTALNLSGQYNFTAADNGRHTFLFSNLTQAGADTLSVFAVGMPTATAPLTVVPAALSKFVFAAPASIPAGTPFSFTITAEDKFGNVETGYTGTVHFSALANDTQAVLPADYTFTTADAGTHTFSATLFKTAGASSPFINAKDLATGVNTFATIFVTPLAPASLSVTSLSSPYVAGTLAGVTVTAVDIYGNRATELHRDHPRQQLRRAGRACRPTTPSRPPTAASHSFLVALKTAGTQSFSVADTVNPAFASTQSGIVVVPAAASVFAFTGLPPRRRPARRRPSRSRPWTPSATGHRILARSSSAAATARRVCPPFTCSRWPTRAATRSRRR